MKKDLRKDSEFGIDYIWYWNNEFELKLINGHIMSIFTFTYTLS